MEIGLIVIEIKAQISIWTIESLNNPEQAEEISDQSWPKTEIDIFNFKDYNFFYGHSHLLREISLFLLMRSIKHHT